MRHFFGHLSIQRKLVLSMALCLLAFLSISGVLSVWLIGNAVREREVSEGLPTAVGQIAADVQRRVAVPLTAARALAQDAYLQAWEEQGLPASGEETFTRHAKQLKQFLGAATVFWVSKETGHYYTDSSLARSITANDTWFTHFLASGEHETIDIDRENASSPYMLFINVRSQTAGGKLAVSGVGLDVDSLTKSVGEYRLADTGHAWLVRANGVILTHSDASLVDGKHLLRDLPGFDEKMSQALLVAKPFALAQLDGRDGPQFVASSYLPELHAYVIAQVPERELLGPVNRAIRTATLLAALAGGAIALAVILVVSRAIARPVQRAATLLDEIADGQGDLTRRMDVESSDEIGQLARAFNRFVGSLSQMVRQVRETGDSIATGSAEIAHGNADLSQRTEEQAANLQQTASSMEQLTHTVRQNAENARAAAQLVSGAAVSAAKGGDTVRHAVQTMTQVSESSRRIADIVGVVDGIAFQTNILALNAAVEAARAGEQGRGFAVVASEVRSLAQRSASAARDIKTMIARSVLDVESGAKQVAQAGHAMDEIVTQVGRVNHLVGEISSASQEQSLGIGQVGDAVAQLDQVTQQNAALVEQSAAAAESLKAQAARLSVLMGSFTIA